MCASGAADTAALSFSFSDAPSDADLATARAFHATLEHATLEQYPGVQGALHDTRPGSLFLAQRDQAIVCCAWITERRSRGFDVAAIEFGPLFDDPAIAAAAINAMLAHYMQRGFALLTVGLDRPADATTDALVRKLDPRPTSAGATGERDWSSLHLDLSHDTDALLRGMSKGHRSGIRKATRMGVSVRPAQGTDDIDGFAAVLLKMHQARNQQVDPTESVTLLHDTLALLSQTGMGELLVVEDREDVLIGGVIIVDQGSVARYYKGAADPDIRDVAVLHPALFAAMHRARQRGRTIFDLWGYNLHVDATDPRHNINRFKKGFGGEIVSYPAVMDFPLGARGRVYAGLLGMKQWLGQA